MSLLPTLGNCSNVRPFPLSELADSAKLSHDGKLAFLCRGADVEVIRAKLEPPERAAAWSFSSASDAPVTVTALAELIPPENAQVDDEVDDDEARRRTCVLRGLLIGLSNGLVCLLDLKSSRITRAVRIGKRVTAIEVVSSARSINGGLNEAKNRGQIISDELTSTFSGILAVGTQQGHVYLLDLALDNLESASDEDPAVSTEARPASMRLIGPEDDNWAELKRQCVQRKKHLAIRLNATESANQNFHHRATNGNSTYFPEDDVAVTVLTFLPHLSSLAVGFNFGAWQLWSVGGRRWGALDFSSKYHKDSLPIVGFAFQEPQDDPRHFCYIWCAHSDPPADDEPLLDESVEDDLSTVASVALFALSYETKIDDLGPVSLYSDLNSCCKRFEYTLDTGEAKRSALLSCGTLGFRPGSVVGTAAAANVGSFQEAESSLQHSVTTTAGNQNVGANLGLAFFLWETRNSDDRSAASDYFYGLFDLNSWYQAQMPSRVDKEEESGFRHQCPYFSLCSLSDVVSTNPSSDVLLNAAVDMGSVSRFKSLTNAEQHFYPSSLAFDVLCVLNRGIVVTSNLGLQRKVLLELQMTGRASGLTDPSRLYELCAVSGLIDCADNDLTDDERRKQLLTVALENHLVNLLVGCAANWRDGKYASAGCTPKLLMDWAWQRISATKSSLDRAIVPLFDNSRRTDLAEAARKSLSQSSQQLKHLCLLLQRLRGGDLQLDELLTKRTVSALLSLYLEVVLWFFHAGLLPEEVDEGEHVSGAAAAAAAAYPASLLTSTYARKRKSSRKLTAALEPTLGAQATGLMIDGLCRGLGPVCRANFEREGGNGEYPPPSLYSLLSVYLIHPEDDDDDEKHHLTFLKHRIVQYLFLDIAAHVNGSNEQLAPLVEHLIKFPSAFSLPPSLIKLTQAFWLLDHEDFDEAISVLLDPLVKPEDISPWQHRAILVAFLVNERPRLALKYFRVRASGSSVLSNISRWPSDPADAQLRICILLANGMVHDAFQFQRGDKKGGKNQPLLRYFYQRAEEIGKLDTVLQLPLTPVEETELVAFLKEADKMEVLLMYYLQRARFSEAAALNQEMEKSSMMKKPSENIRKALIEKFGNGLQMFNRNQLPPEGDKMKLTTFDKQRTVPLSIEIRDSPGFNPVFHSSAIREEMERRRQMQKDQCQEPFTPFRSKQQPDYSRFKETAEKSNLPSFSPSYVTETPPTYDNSRALPPLSAAGKERKSRLFKDEDFRLEILSILETPKIIKKKRSSLMTTSAFTATPSSILKVKRTTEASSASPVPPLSSSNAAENIVKVFNLSGAEDEEEGDDNETWLTKPPSRSRETTPGKTLRFHVPKTYPPTHVSNDDKENSALVNVSTEDVQEENESMEPLEREEEHLSEATPDGKTYAEKLADLLDDDSMEEAAASITNVAGKSRRESIYSTPPMTLPPPSSPAPTSTSNLAESPRTPPTSGRRRKSSSSTVTEKSSPSSPDPTSSLKGSSPKSPVTRSTSSHKPDSPSPSITTRKRKLSSELEISPVKSRRKSSSSSVVSKSSPVTKKSPEKGASGSPRNVPVAAIPPKPDKSPVALSASSKTTPKLEIEAPSPKEELETSPRKRRKNASPVKDMPSPGPNKSPTSPKKNISPSLAKAPSPVKSKVSESSITSPRTSRRKSSSASSVTMKSSSPVSKRSRSSPLRSSPSSLQKASPVKKTPTRRSRRVMSSTSETRPSSAAKSNTKKKSASFSSIAKKPLTESEKMSSSSPQRSDSSRKKDNSSIKSPGKAQTRIKTPPAAITEPMAARRSSRIASTTSEMDVPSTAEKSIHKKKSASFSSVTKKPVKQSEHKSKSSPKRSVSSKSDDTYSSSPSPRKAQTPPIEEAKTARRSSRIASKVSETPKVASPIKSSAKKKSASFSTRSVATQMTPMTTRKRRAASASQSSVRVSPPAKSKVRTPLTTATRRMKKRSQVAVPLMANIEEMDETPPVKLVKTGKSRTRSETLTIKTRTRSSGNKSDSEKSAKSNEDVDAATPTARVSRRTRPSTIKRPNLAKIEEVAESTADASERAVDFHEVMEEIEQVEVEETAAAPLRRSRRISGRSETTAEKKGKQKASRFLEEDDGWQPFSPLLPEMEAPKRKRGRPKKSENESEQVRKYVVPSKERTRYKLD